MVHLNYSNTVENSIATSKQENNEDINQTVKATQDNEEINTINRNNIEEIQEIYSDGNKETDHLYEEVEDTEANKFPQEMEGVQSHPQYYNEAMNSPTKNLPQNTRRQALNEFRIWYARPKFPKKNSITERLSQPKKPHKVTNPFLYSDFRGMIHADYQEALENLDIHDEYSKAMSLNRGFGQNNLSQTGMSTNLRGKKKFSESVKEMFPMPEFNSYLSDPTKKKERRKINKPHTAAIGFRSKGSLNKKS